MITYAYEDGLYIKLFEALDKTNKQIVIVYRSIGADGRIYTRAREEFNKLFIQVKAEL